MDKYVIVASVWVFFVCCHKTVKYKVSRRSRNLML
jgi:hypothetical protein